MDGVFYPHLLILPFSLLPVTDSGDGAETKSYFLLFLMNSEILTVRGRVEWS